MRDQDVLPLQILDKSCVKIWVKITCKFLKQIKAAGIPRILSALINLFKNVTSVCICCYQIRFYYRLFLNILINVTNFVGVSVQLEYHAVSFMSL